ncbi:hypothetical protein GE061_013327 [Apolygus lucorum]|uniref:Uncharacterized protein n=1 Tax=Apolygus lucorum TaxID=248454 RepID=A0A6A4KF76_APOLU|nr:hypothetical protein GE061_013327 [Apolygus lucorum]
MYNIIFYSMPMAIDKDWKEVSSSWSDNTPLFIQKLKIFPQSAQTRHCYVVRKGQDLPRFTVEIISSI